MEELWAFNEEIVARSIFASVIPVISAVGHETDYTIADFVADKRAETPTAAAQLSVPDIQVLKEYLKDLKIYLQHSIDSRMNHAELKIKSNNISNLQLILKNRIHMLDMRVVALHIDMDNSIKQRITNYGNQLEMLMTGLSALNPQNIMERGYAAILDKQGLLAGSVERFEEGDNLFVVFKDGQANCEVQEIRRSETSDKAIR